LSGFGGLVVGFKEYASGLFWTFLGLQVDFKNSIYIIILDFFGLFWAILKPNQQLYVIEPTNLVFLAFFLLFI
jgi:hypothetical protein